METEREVCLYAAVFSGSLFHVLEDLGMTYYLVLILGTLSVYTNEKAACDEYSNKRKIGDGPEMWKLDLWDFECEMEGTSAISKSIECYRKRMAESVKIIKGSCRPKEEFFFEGEGK